MGVSGTGNFLEPGESKDWNLFWVIVRGPSGNSRLLTYSVGGSGFPLRKIHMARYLDPPRL